MSATLASLACTSDPPELVRRTIGPAGGLVSSHDEVLTIVLQPGALTREIELEIFPSDEPPLIFGPAYRVRPDIDLQVDAEITYRRVLPNNTAGVAVAAIRLDDYTSEMGHWVPLPRLAIDEASGAVLASDSSLSLYYGMLEAGDGSGPSTMGNDTDPGGDTDGSTGADPTAGTGDPTAGTGDPTTGTGDPTTGDPTDPTAGGCGDGVREPGMLCFSVMDYPMADGPVAVVLGDFDDDGRLDVATANDGGSFSVRLGDGAGGLGAEASMATSAGAGTAPTAIAAGDLDQTMGDDLVVTLSGTNELLLLQSQGDGTFAPAAVVLTGTVPSDVLVVDVNDDAVPDILVACAGTTTVSYFPFAGGLLGGETLYGTGVVDSPVGMAWGQYNSGADMFEDLLTFGAGSYSGLPGSGVGLADAQIGGAVGTDLRGAIGGDLGGDAAGDAVVADFTEGGAYILIGDGAASFVSTDFIATGAGAIDVTAGDFDGDGDDDLAVANFGAGTVTVLEKTGASTWGNPTDYDVGGSPSGITSGDLDGDGIWDIVVSNATGDGLTVLTSDP